VAERGRLGVRLAEHFRGYVSTDASLDYEEAARAGKRDHMVFEADLQIVSDDLDHLVESGEALLEGAVRVPALADGPLTLEDGVFTLMATSPTAPGARETRYRASLRGADSSALAFSGLKRVQDDPGLDSLSDVTTMFVSIDADGDEARPLARGVATMGQRDLLRSIRSIEVTNAGSTRERLEATARFGRLCMGPLFEVYGPTLT
jgi:cholesterol oxidase